MTDIRFYHLQVKPLQQALPEILSKAYERGHRVVVMAENEKHVESLNALLWTYGSKSFLPHGSEKEGDAKDQPIWLTVKDENPNSADVLVLVDGVTSENIKGYKLCCEVFDGNDEQAVKQSRKHWKSYKEDGYELTYYQQTNTGGWQEK